MEFAILAIVVVKLTEYAVKMEIDTIIATELLVTKMIPGVHLDFAINIQENVVPKMIYQIYVIMESAQLTKIVNQLP